MPQATILHQTKMIQVEKLSIVQVLRGLNSRATRSSKASLGSSPRPSWTQLPGCLSRGFTERGGSGMPLAVALLTLSWDGTPLRLAPLA